MVILGIRAMLPGSFWPRLFLLGRLLSAVIVLDVLHSDPALADLLGSL